MSNLPSGERISSPDLPEPNANQGNLDVPTCKTLLATELPTNSNAVGDFESPSVETVNLPASESKVDDSSSEQCQKNKIPSSTSLGVSSDKICGDDSPSPSDEGENMDGRTIGEWESRYPPDACKEIKFDAWFVGILLFIILISLLLLWNGALYKLLSFVVPNSPHSAKTFSKFFLFFLGGLLGGTLFGIKYLYKAVGRGSWNLDRRLWRIFSPLVSGGLALAVGAMIDSGIVGLTANAHSSSAYLSMGFITGYFADGALAKMQDVADTIFGSARRFGSGHSAKK